MFKRILIANRGEIAVRIIRTCQELGIEAVAVYSNVDSTSLHVQLADHAVCIGPAKAADSYLNMKNILSVATALGCDAIHPGFGFLSENSTFARLVEECGITFIGPSGDVIDMMGNKSMARQKMIEAGVPVVPGSDGSVNTLQEAKEVANQIGYPVLIKASAGGGGRGMRKAFSEEEFDDAYLTAKAEAKACFGDDDMYLEKLILNPKHIEFQILADNYGNVIHLGERDCSIQRRNQKMIEEARQELKLVSADGCLVEENKLKKSTQEKKQVVKQPENYENSTAKIAALRIDDRLIHGQVAMTWTKQLKVQGIVVANDEAANDPTQKMALKMAVPAGIKVLIKPVQEAIRMLNHPKAEKMRILVLTRTVKDAVTVRENVGEIGFLNLGNTGRFDGIEASKKQSLSPTIMLTKEEIQSLKKLVELDDKVCMQQVPNDEQKLVKDVLGKLDE